MSDNLTDSKSSAPGGEDAFVQLLTEHQASLRAYITSLIPGSPNVKDVLQETNMTLWKKRDRFQIGSNFIAWSFAVARFSVKEQHARARRDHRLVFNDELLDIISLSSDEAVESDISERNGALNSCLKKLSPKEQDIIDARYMRGRSLEKHAVESGRNAGALRVALFRIRAALRKCIERELSASTVTS